MTKPSKAHYCADPSEGVVKGNCYDCRRRWRRFRADMASNNLASRKPGRYDLSELEAEAERRQETIDESGQDRDTPPEVLVLGAIRANLKNGNYGRCQFCGTVYNPRSISVCPLCRREA